VSVSGNTNGEASDLERTTATVQGTAPLHSPNGKMVLEAIPADRS
jgi:hypothetical protein